MSLKKWKKNGFIEVKRKFNEEVFVAIYGDFMGAIRGRPKATREFRLGYKQ
jgi:hypothetical protein